MRLFTLAAAQLPAVPALAHAISHAANHAAAHAVAPLFALGPVDWAIMIVYFVFVLGIGFALKRFTKSSEDFFLSGRAIPAWVCGLAFISANLGSQEVLGMGASGAQYGIMTANFYWIGAIPAMVFVGLFMMPFYYGSKARSVPEYLKLRFDEKTRVFNAITFAVMTIFSSGISMYALAILLNALLGWNFNLSLVLSAIIVLVYIFLGGLTSAIYNEVVQFFLIVMGFVPLAIVGLENVGGWSGLKQKLQKVAIQQHFAPSTWTHVWKYSGNAHSNPVGVEWFGMIMGLGFVLSFGYWCTDFLVVQRAMAADSMTSARRTPLIAAVPKMLFPALVILPGMIAAALAAHARSTGFVLPMQGGKTNYNMATPALLGYYFPEGMLGLGLTALMASFMSGMAGNVTAFNTVWTYDLYQGYIKPDATDQHLLWVGRLTTIVGIALSIGAAYFALHFDNIMNLLQEVFGFVNAPLFATLALGMFWKRSTGHGAFWGLVAGTLAAAVVLGCSVPPAVAGTMIPAAWGLKGGWLSAALGMHPHVFTSGLAQAFWIAIWAFVFSFGVGLVISLFTPRLKADADLNGLVYSMTPKPVDTELAWYKKPWVLAVIVLGVSLLLNIIFW